MVGQWSDCDLFESGAITQAVECTPLVKDLDAKSPEGATYKKLWVDAYARSRE